MSYNFPSWLRLKATSVLVFLSALGLVWGTSSCDPAQEKQKLAQLYCGSCHLFPEPDLLDKKIWLEGVLPEMAIRMGIAKPDVNLFDPDEHQRIMLYGGLPLKPLLSQQEWDKIVAYYRENAPEKASTQQKIPQVDSTQLDFQPEIVWRSPGAGPNFSMLKFLPKQHQLITGQREGKVFIFGGKNLQLQDSLLAPSAASDVGIGKQGQLQLLLMGKMDPSDWYNGSLLEIGKEEGRWKLLRHLQDSLNRPVHFVATDLNADQKEDFLVSEFGHYLGRLAWHEPQTKGKAIEHDLFRGPGARVTQVVDLNQDGKNDILALLSQGNEKIVWFKNLGKGVFEGIELVRFLPIYGSSYLEVKDINNDGKLDLIHSAGDNYDYSYALKNYHGVRIFINQGNQNFKEQKFLPLHGVGKVLAEDFDQDGNMDLACISYFPDYTQKPLAGFVLYKNHGNLHFTAHTYPLANAANWLLMDKGDVDQDGDVDILLGSCSINNTVPQALRQSWTKQGIGVLLLRNRLK